MEKLTYCLWKHLTAHSWNRLYNRWRVPPLMTACVTASRGSRGPGFLAELTQSFKKKKMNVCWEGSPGIQHWREGEYRPWIMVPALPEMTTGPLPSPESVSSTVNRRMGTSSWRSLQAISNDSSRGHSLQQIKGENPKEESQNSQWLTEQRSCCFPYYSSEKISCRNDHTKSHIWNHIWT